MVEDPDALLGAESVADPKWTTRWPLPRTISPAPGSAAQSPARAPTGRYGHPGVAAPGEIQQILEAGLSLVKLFGSAPLG